jgi:hypothetical protein
MVILDLFSGTGSVSNAAQSRGYNAVSLDRDMDASIKTDVMEWNYQQLPPRMFDLIWASPPCTEYSRAKTTAPRKIHEANKVVERTLEIIRYFEPKYFVIENPQTGLLKEQEFMQELDYVDVDYCKYGFPYRKRTRLWNNFKQQLEDKVKPLCKKDCNSMNEARTRHIAEAQRMPSGKKANWGERRKFEQAELYKVPEPLINDVLDAAGLSGLGEGL